MPFDETPYLEALFTNADHVMWELSDHTGRQFTNYKFIRCITQVNQGAYIRFLYAMMLDRGEEDNRLFHQVHTAIGIRLSSEAQNLGYEQNKAPGIKEYDIFGRERKDSVVAYVRTAQVSPPQ